MKKSFVKGFIFTGIVGVLLHFLFDLTGGSVFIAPFSAVNESIWEHIKLVFFPMFVFSVIESRHFKKIPPNYWCIELIGTAWGAGLVPVLYYTLSGAIGELSDWVNIAIFFVSAGVGYLVKWWLFNKNCIKCKNPKWAITIFVLIAVLFAVLTFIPPKLPIFEDPVTNTYGI